MNLQNRWFQLVASLIAMIMIANLQYAWTFFVQPLDGWLIDRLGPRGFISAAGLLCGLGWAGLGYASSLPMLYVLYCLAGTGAAFVYSASIGSALKWFKARRGLAAGIMAAGFGGGTALFIPIISRLIETRGYQTTFLVTGIVQGVVIVAVAQVLRHPSREPVTAVSTGPIVPIDRRQFTTKEMLGTAQFYVMYVMFVLMATGGLLVTANAGPMAKSWGLPAAALTLAGTLSPLANGASRIFWGWVSDRVGRENTMMVAFVLQAVCLVLVLALGRLSGGWFAFSLVLVYFTWGEIFGLFPATSGDYFGTRHATSNYSVLYTAKGVAAIIGGWFAAFLYERTGSWSIGFYGSAAMALVAAGLAVGLRATASRHATAVVVTEAK